MRRGGGEGHFQVTVRKGAGLQQVRRGPCACVGGSRCLGCAEEAAVLAELRKEVLGGGRGLVAWYPGVVERTGT